ncbi:MAG: diacylglycerol kinase family enzyme [Planctomycetota bacterium]
MPQTALILANPTAKRGEAAVRRVIAKLTAGYEAAGWKVIAHCTERDGPRERDLVAAHADDVQTIVAIGGDGTVRETVLGMSDAQRKRIAIGFVPVGNANVLAREVGIPVDDEDAAVAIVLQGHQQPMDAGAVDGEPTFLLMLDVGYFAEVVHAVAAARQRGLTRWLYSLGGDLFYTCIGLLKLLSPNRAKVTVTADDQEPFLATSIAIANAHVYAKTGSFCPDADPGDGVLNFNAARSWQTLRYSFAAMSGKPSETISRLGTAERFTLRANALGFFCQVDGDPIDGRRQELTVNVLRRYYSLITPTER